MQVVRRADWEEATSNASIELMNCSSFRGDRLGFERWRERCEARRESMPPNMVVDFALKTAIGLARFGQLDRAEALLDVALHDAQEGGLHEFLFRIERIKNGLR